MSEAERDYSESKRQTARAETRGNLAARYAELIGTYQQDQRHLMEMLRDDAVSAQAFSEAADRLTVDVRELKTIRLEMSRQRRVIEDSDGPLGP